MTARAIDRADCQALDRDDPLARFRARFELPDGIIYMDGNSLGPLPCAVAPRIERVIREQWGHDLITSWNRHGWIDLPHRVGARIAALIGAGDDEVVVADSTSVNLFKLAGAVLRLNPERRVVVSERGNFPTDVYMLEGLAQLLGPDYELRLVERETVLDALDERVALLALTHVHYKTGEIFDMAAITGAAHDCGALMLWDLCHSAGALPVDLHAANADLAIGCGYKFLNGGPGAPAYLYVAKRLQDRLEPPLAGWIGHAAPFAFEDHYRPAPGIRRQLCGTPAVLSLAALDAALEVYADVDMKAVRDKAVRLGDLFLDFIEQRCAGLGLEIACPRNGHARGSQVALRHDQGYAVMQALIAGGVIGDFRAPDVLRFGITPLYQRYTDMWDAVDILKTILERRDWDRPEFHRRATVT